MDKVETTRAAHGTAHWVNSLHERYKLEFPVSGDAVAAARVEGAYSIYDLIDHNSIKETK